MFNDLIKGHDVFLYNQPMNGCQEFESERRFESIYQFLHFSDPRCCIRIFFERLFSIFFCAGNYLQLFPGIVSAISISGNEITFYMI